MGRLALVLGVLTVALAACGPAAQAPTDRQWLANANGLVQQLRNDLVLSAAGGPDVPSARHALADDSDLYDLLIAYSDFGGCNQMVGNIGAASGRLVRVERTLTRACIPLERASRLFSVAASSNDPHALLSAGRIAQTAEALLVRADLQLLTRSVR